MRGTVWPNPPSHEDVETVHLRNVGGQLHWRIVLTDGFSTEVSDDDIRKWLAVAGRERPDDLKISYRRFAKYARHVQENADDAAART